MEKAVSRAAVGYARQLKSLEYELQMFTDFTLKKRLLWLPEVKVLCFISTDFALHKNANLHFR